MTRKPVSWRQAGRAVAIAIALLLAFVVVGANFVLVEVRLPGLRFQTRLAWVLLVAVAVGYAAGVVMTSGRRTAREPARQADDDTAAG